MPDIVDLIKAQHREIVQLLGQAESEGADTKAVMRQVSDLLLPHSEAEESFVYPTIRQYDKSEAAEVKDGAAEHHHMEGILKELLGEAPDDPGYDGKLAALCGELRHHIEEEEQDLLPVLTENASAEEREHLGERFAQATGAADVSGAADDQQSADGSGGSDSSSGGDSSSEGTSSGGNDDLSRDELYEKAKEQDVAGRSQMSKAELRDALEES